MKYYSFQEGFLTSAMALVVASIRNDCESRATAGNNAILKQPGTMPRHVFNLYSDSCLSMLAAVPGCSGGFDP